MSGAPLHPVLAVRDVAAARRRLAADFGWIEDGALLRLGDQRICVTEAGQRPARFIGLPLDHVALSVADADSTWNAFLARGARIDTAFTPDGPRDIPQFWSQGVRFIFFAGPEGWPLEFCAENGNAMAPAAFGHSHYGIRCPDVAKLTRDLVAKGAATLAEHRLDGPQGTVSVAFLRFGPVILELFDEPPFAPPRENGWIGLAEG